MRFKLKIFIFALFTMISALTTAQKMIISGRVIDDSDRPISYANVLLIRASDSTFVKGTSTNDNGSFEFSVQESQYLIKASFIGYKTVTRYVDITSNTVLDDFILTEGAETLEQIDIIARKPTITRQPDRLIFNVENTALIEGSTLQVLKNTPGVIVSDAGINIKSAPAVIYINERRVQLSSTELLQLLESAPANSIKSVEVITNPPASYDADSGSVINIIMSKNLITGYRGSVYSNYTQGVFPRYNYGTSHFFKNSKINFNVNYNYSNEKINRDQDDRVNYLDNNNLIDEIWQSDVNRNTWTETHNANLNFDYFIDDNNTLSVTSTALFMPYFKYKIRNNTIIEDSANNFLSRFTADNLSRDEKYNIGTDIIFKHRFEDESSLTFNGHFTLFDYNRDQDVFSNFFDSDNAFIDDAEFNTVANQNTEIFTAKVDYKLPISEESNFDAGAKFSKVLTDSDITRTDIVNGVSIINPQDSDAFRYDEEVSAAYANYSTSWDKWSLNLGMRVEYTEIEGTSLTLNETNYQDYLNWFPNASISYQLLEDMSLYTSYKRSITRPSYTNLNPFTFYLNENTVVLGNPNLTPTYLDHYKIGTSFLEYFTVEAYYQVYNDNIVELPRQDNTTNIIAFTPINIDLKEEFGFDFLFDYYPTNRWNIYAVTSFYKTTEEANFGEGNVRLEQWSNFSVLSNNLMLLEDNSLSINLTMYWAGKNLQGLRVVDDRIISMLTVSKSILKKKGTISLSVEDLFNEQDYNINVRYLNQSNSNFTNLDNRFIKLGFRYNFGNTKLSTNERATQAEERDRIEDLD